MTRKLYAALSIVAFVAIAAPAASAPGVPFHAHFVLSESQTADLACGGFRVRNTGAGDATLLGQTAWRATACADFLDRPGKLHARDGHAVMTAQRGGELYVSYSGEGDLPDLSGHFHVTGPFRITGGTGLFRAATGSGVVTGDGSVASPEVIVDASGTLALSE